MSVELKTFHLEDVLDALIDYRGKTPKKTSSGIPLITAKIVKAGKILPTQEYIAHENFNSWMVRGLPKLGDVVLTTEAPLGEVAQINELPVALAQRIVTLRGRQNVLLNDYLKYLLLSPQTQEKLHGRSSGSTVVGIKQSELRKIEVQLPSIVYQTRVARILKSLDNHIDNLEAQNTTLEALAQTLFRSWFVNFDPVYAKAAGQTPEGMSPELAALFPSEFVESELGMIPKGWKVDFLSNQLKALESGKRPKGGVGGITEGIPSIGAESINGLGRFEFGKTKYVSEDFYNTIKKGIPEDFDLLIYKDGGKPGEFFPKFGMYGLGFPFRKFALNEHVFLARAGGQLSPSFLYFLAQERSFYDHLKERGTKVAVPGVNQRDVGEFQLVVPTSDLIQAFSNIGQPVVEQVLTNCLQCRTLSELRDELLPRLISGKLRIKEAEEAVSVVLGSAVGEEKAA